MIILNYNQIEILNTLKQKWWFAPEIIDKKYTKLISNATKIIPQSEKIENASDLSIRIRGVYVHEGFDKSLLRKKKTNDLFVTSSFQVGKNPIVQRVHKYAPKKKPKEYVGDFFKTAVCSFSDFTSDHINLLCQVYDVDSHKDLVKNVKDVTSLLSNAAIFPVLTPYITIGSKIANAVVNLIEKTDQHRPIIDERLLLRVIDPNKGSRVLQTGHWVCFSEPQERLKITPNMRIVKNDNSRFTDCSYAVYTIRNEVTKEPKWEITQKMATLITELRGKGESGQAGIGFLRSTLEGYTNFKKLQRIKQLENKKKRAPGKKLTFEEKNRLEKLRKEPQLVKVLSETTKETEERPRKTVQHKPLIDSVERRNKLRRRKLDELHRKFKSGELKVNNKEYAEMREAIHNKYGFTREWMEKMTEKYYSN